jgi:hypothetical protein
MANDGNDISANSKMLEKYGLVPKGGFSAAPTPAAQADSNPPSPGGLLHNVLGLGHNVLGLGGTFESMGEGAGHGAALMAVDAGRLARNFVPTSVADRVSNLPGMQRLTDYADSPYEGPAEAAGSWLTQGALALMGPGEARLGNLAREAIERFWPEATKVAYRGRGFAGEAPQIREALPHPAQQFADRWAHRANVAEQMGRGAIPGAMGDPNDPLTGAGVGAITGGLASPIAAGMQSSVGRFMGAHAAPAALWGLLHSATGLPYHDALALGPLITWYASPVGKRLREVGGKIVTETGRIVGEIAQKQPRTLQAGGYAAGSGASYVVPQDEEP